MPRDEKPKADKKQGPSPKEADERNKRPSITTDVDQIPLGELPQQPFPAAVGAEYRVLISRSAFEAIREHAKSDESVELCGVLAGRLLREGNAPYLMVEEAVSGLAARRSGSQVTFTHETWEHIHREMEKKHPQLQIVGWYHTHPGFGIFLSEMDQFIQDNFFNLPHQVAFVYDPRSERRGLFAWRQGRPTRLRRYWLAGELCYDLEPEGTPDEDPQEVGEESLEERVRTAKEEGENAVRAPRVRLPGIWLFVALLAALLAFWIGGLVEQHRTRQVVQAWQEDYRRRADAEQDALLQLQLVVLQNLVRTGLFRDGLDEALTGPRQELAALSLRLQKAQSSASAEQAKELAEIAAEIQATSRRLASVAELYASADRLAAHLKDVAAVPLEMRKVSHAVGQSRSLLARLCIQRARELLEEERAGGGEPKRRQAERYRQLALEAAPELKSEIDQNLPELAPGGTEQKASSAKGSSAPKE